MEVSFPFLVESALLTHGLASVTEETLLARWPAELQNIVWVSRGSVCTGGMAEFLAFRRSEAPALRIDCCTLEDSLREGRSGALTASGTMAVCLRCGIPLAVTCGMGGIGDIRGEELCPDLPALRDLPVALISTSPKDVVDIPATLRWLRENGVTVLGAGTDRCTGYLLRSTDVPLSGVLQDTLPQESHVLILQGIPEEQRIRELSMLPAAIAEGKEAEQSGAYFHPAANRAFDRMSGGLSSSIQLDSLIRNALLAKRLTETE